MEGVNGNIFKQRLIEEHELLRLRLMQEEESLNIEPQVSPDRADLAWTYNQRMTRTALAARTEKQLEEINAALQRMEDGFYGKCSNCAQDIQLDRLKAIPWVELCVNCQQLLEN